VKAFDAAEAPGGLDLVAVALGYTGNPGDLGSLGAAAPTSITPGG